MDSQDIIRTGRRAKSETEAFINRYLNDRAKGWPKLCLCSSVCTACPQGQPAVRVAGQQVGAGLRGSRTAAMRVFRGVERAISA
jgi:hypothetical protein